MTNNMIPNNIHALFICGFSSEYNAKNNPESILEITPIKINLLCQK